MELLSRHTIDNRGTARPVTGPPSRAARNCARSCRGSRFPWASARAANVQRRRRLPDPIPVRGLPRLSPTRHSCPNCAATPTTCAANGKQCSPPAPPTGQPRTLPASSTSSPAISARTRRHSTICPPNSARSGGGLSRRPPRPPPGPGHPRALPQEGPAVTDNSAALRRAPPRRPGQTPPGAGRYRDDGRGRGSDKLPLRRSARRGFRLPALRRQRPAHPDRRGMRPSAPGRGPRRAASCPLTYHRGKPARRPCQRQGTERGSPGNSRSCATGLPATWPPPPTLPGAVPPVPSWTGWRSGPPTLRPTTPGYASRSAG